MSLAKLSMKADFFCVIFSLMMVQLCNCEQRGIRSSPINRTSVGSFHSGVKIIYSALITELHPVLLLCTKITAFIHGFSEKDDLNSKSKPVEERENNGCSSQT